MISNRKITAYQDNIISLSDRPAEDGITTAQLKAIFDGRTDKEVKNAINGIIDDLTSEAVGSSGADNIKATPIAGIASNTVQGILAGLDNKKVDKVTGKQLSTEDYSTAEKNKLAGIEVGANNYVLPKASPSELGGIKIGIGLEAMPDGTVNGVAAPAPDLVARQEIADHKTTANPHNITPALIGSEPANLNLIKSNEAATMTASLKLYGNATQDLEAVPKQQLDNPQAVVGSQAASFTLALADGGKLIEVNSASTVTVTIPTNATVAFAMGTQITLIRAGVGDVTVAAVSGVTLYSSESKVKIDKQHQAVSLIKVAENTWRLIGALA